MKNDVRIEADLSRLGLDSDEGFRVFALVMQNELPISAIRRVLTAIDGEPTGPYSEIAFPRKPDYLP